MHERQISRHLLSKSARLSLAGCAVALIACFGLPVLAGKAGSIGQRSSATVTISLEVKPTMTATRVPASAEKAWAHDVDGDYLCISLSDRRPMAVYFVTAEGERVSLTSFHDNADAGVWRANDRSQAGCAATVPLSLADFSTSRKNSYLLLISPE